MTWYFFGLVYLDFAQFEAWITLLYFPSQITVLCMSNNTKKHKEVNLLYFPFNSFPWTFLLITSFWQIYDYSILSFILLLWSTDHSFFLCYDFLFHYIFIKWVWEETYSSQQIQQYVFLWDIDIISKVIIFFSFL